MKQIKPISLYVHIPFCETKCPYCDFNTYSGIESLIPTYIDALEYEIRLWGSILPIGQEVKTVFVGGGTPSYLPEDKLISVMEAIRDTFSVDPNVEITMEANPGDFDSLKLESYLSEGINRISIGVQSFDDDLLKQLGRKHSSIEAQDAYQAASEAGFENISLDLMYGLPFQNIEHWEQTLDVALSLMPSHMSLYCLTLEGGTPMERQVRLGTIPTPDADLAADMYLRSLERMSSAGYRNYEISNWCLPGFESRHNIAYWENKSYLGVGPGAHSYLSGFRFNNLNSPRIYISKIDEHSTNLSEVKQYETMKNKIKSVPVVDNVEHIDKQMQMAETLMMGLRLDYGISLEEFNRSFHGYPSDFYGDTIAELEGLGLLIRSEKSLVLTAKGKRFGNQVFSRFFDIFQ